MMTFALATDLDLIVTTTLGTVIAMHLASIVLALPLRRHWSEAQALGLLTWMGAGDMSLYLSRWLGLNLAQFAILTVTLAMAIIAVARYGLFRHHHRGQVDSLALPLFLSLATLFILVRLMTPFPQSGYSIFQGLYPAYIQHALASGGFPEATQTGIGAGFFARNHLAYPMDTVGFAALAAWIVKPQNVHAVYLGSTIAPGISVIALFLYACRNRVAMAAMVVLYLVFLRFGDSLRLPLLDNWVDNVLLMAGGVCIYSLMQGTSYKNSHQIAFFSASFMVFSRPYGAMYAGIIAVVLILYKFIIFYRGTLRFSSVEYKAWAVTLLFLIIFSLNEIIKIVLGGIYHAQPFYATATPTASNLLLGTLADWGLIPDDSHFRLFLPMGLFCAIALAILALLKWGRYSRSFWIRCVPYWAPFLLLAGPLILEAATGYRRGMGNFSKLYIGAQYLFVFYPALLMNHALGTRRLAAPLRPEHTLLPRLSWAGLGLGLCLCLGAVWMKPDTLRTKADYVVGTYASHNVDYLLGAKLSTDPQRLELVRRKVLFLYHEPGMALRYFIGGDLFDDHDFWGPHVQGLIANGVSLQELLHQLDYPMIWISFPGWINLGTLTNQTASLPMAEAIEKLDATSLLVDRVIAVQDARLVVTQPPPRADQPVMGK